MAGYLPGDDRRTDVGLAVVVGELEPEPVKSRLKVTQFDAETFVGGVAGGPDHFAFALDPALLTVVAGPERVLSGARPLRRPPRLAARPGRVAVAAVAAVERLGGAEGDRGDAEDPARAPIGAALGLAGLALAEAAAAAAVGRDLDASHRRLRPSLLRRRRHADVRRAAVAARVLAVRRLAAVAAALQLDAAARGPLPGGSTAGPRSSPALPGRSSRTVVRPPSQPGAPLPAAAKTSPASPPAPG